MPHDKNCRMYIAANCAVGVECPHGFDVCHVCDPCTCAGEAPRVPVTLSLDPEPIAKAGDYYTHDKRS